jgi:hypothetical protein
MSPQRNYNTSKLSGSLNGFEKCMADWGYVLSGLALIGAFLAFSAHAVHGSAHAAMLLGSLVLMAPSAIVIGGVVATLAGRRLHRS